LTLLCWRYRCRDVLVSRLEGRVSVLSQESEENARSDAKWKDADECLMDASVCDDYL